MKQKFDVLKYWNHDRFKLRCYESMIKSGENFILAAMGVGIFLSGLSPLAIIAIGFFGVGCVIIGALHETELRSKGG